LRKHSKKLFKKRGALQDAVVVIVALFVIAIVIAVITHAQRTITESLNESGELGSNAQTIMEDNITGFPGRMESLFTVLVFGLGLAAIILAFQINTHPVFFVVFGLGLLFIIVITPVFSNVYEEITGDTAIYASTSDLTMTNFIMGAYPKIMLIISTLIAVVMFAKGGGEG